MNVEIGPAWRSAPIDLAHEADFALGQAVARPSQCEVIVQGRAIRLQPRVMQVLVALVRAGGEVVSREELVASCWGGLSIGDDAISRCIGRLRRLARDEALGSFTIETIARIGYRLAVSGAADAAAPISRTSRRTPMWRLGAMTLAVLLLGAGTWLALGRPGWPRPADGVAVMLFDTPPGDPFARNFAEGVADELAHTLSRADLKTLRANAAAGLTSQERDAAAVRLGAAFVLGGRVQRNGNALRVSVAVNDARRHEILWSANFSRPAAEALALQEQVASKIADVLHCTVDANNFGGRIDRGSLGLYLRACDSIGNNDDADRARNLFRQVVAREPKFANAWANMAFTNALAAENLPPDQAAARRAESRAQAERALRLDPKNGMAYAALAIIVPGPDHLWRRQSLLQKGLAVSPDNAALNAQEAELLIQAGRIQEAIAYARRAVVLNPLLPVFTADLAGLLATVGRIVEARAIIERAAWIWPDSDKVLAYRIDLEAQWGDPGRALTLLGDPKSRPPHWEAAVIDDWRRFCLVRQSRDRSAVAAYADDVLARLAAGKLDVSDAVRRLSSLGATDAAFSAAMRSSQSDALDTEALFRPSAESLRRDARFMPLAVRLGLVEFWRRTGKWPDFCEAPDRPYDCRAVAARLSS
jgi:DNA-binding winged helix-turn-helix (wHTH) protein/TolB-like protein/Tfp pilus assembly protein PilF